LGTWKLSLASSGNASNRSLAAPKSLVAPEHRGGGDEGGESAKIGCQPAIENVAEPIRT